MPRSVENSCDASKARSSDLRDEVAGGLRFTHVRTTANTGKLLELASFAYAAIELLAEQGLLKIEELDQRKAAMAKRLVKKYTADGMGAAYQDPELDKYTFDRTVEVDCENRLHLCKAACCRLRFALSRQDVERGSSSGSSVTLTLSRMA